MSSTAASRTPVDENRMVFELGSRPAPEDGTFVRGAGSVSPVVDAVLALPDVRAIAVRGSALVVEKTAEADWESVREHVAHALRMAVMGASQSASDGGIQDDDTLYDQIADFFSSHINPAVARHGGEVELIDVQDALVIVRMKGGCQGCGMANVTLRQGIESSLKKAWPGLRGIHDITDHSAGENPYYS